VYVSKH